MNTQELLGGEELVRTVLDGGRPACLTCSFQASGMAVLHMIRQIEPEIPVLFLDTGYHFAETYAYRDRMAARWRLNLVNLEPVMTTAEQEAIYGRLNVTDPTLCCRMRKVEPLMRALENYDVWFTGLRRDQSPTRANLQPLENHVLPSGKPILKVNPLAFWTEKEVWSYLRVNEIEHLPLYDQGYTSIGCEPCTSLPPDPANARSGRWAGRKLECGIHTMGRPE